MNWLRKSLSDRSVQFYLLAVATVVVLLSLVNCCFSASYHDSMLSVYGMVHFALIHLGDAVLLLLPYWLLPMRWRRPWAWIVVIVVTIWAFTQILYNISYQDIMPYSSFLFTDNVGDVLVGSVIGLIHASALSVLVPVLVLWLVTRRRYATVAQRPLSPGRKWMAAVVSIAVLLVTQAVSFVGIAVHDGCDSWGEKLQDVYTRFMGRYKAYYINNGLTAYTVFSAVTSVNRPMTDEERVMVDAFVAEEVPHYTDNPYAVGQQPNLVLVIVESLNAWAVNLKIDGREVTPVLNSIAADTSSIVALKMQSMIKNGRSSDGKFIYDTGLLPTLDESVAMNYGDADYPSLVKALKGYRSMEICTDAPRLWNIEAMSRSYGFQHLYYQPQFKEKLAANGYRDDELIFAEAAKIVTATRQPFFAQIVTATMHSPYNSPAVPETWISHTKAYTPEVRNYLERVAYFDRHLGLFIDKLRQAGVLDNTVIAIASDHTDFVDDAPSGRPSLDHSGNNCALLIKNAGHGLKITDVIGQVDVYPTLLDIMGANSYQWKGLGYSLLRKRVTSVAVNPDEVVGNKTAAEVPHQRNAWAVSALMIKKNHLPIK